MKLPIFRKISFSLFLIGAGVGLLISVQWKVRPARVVNPLDPFLSLEETEKNLIKEQGKLKKEIARLQKANSAASQQLKENQSETKENVEILEHYKEEVGLIPQKGEGIIIIMDDSSLDEISSDSIAHAADLRDIVNFLWGKGVKSIAINNERVVSTTAIDCIVNTILINKTKITTPFVVAALGQQEEIYEDMKNKDVLPGIKTRIKDKGLKFEVNKVEVAIPAFDGSFTIERAKSIN